MSQAAEAMPAALRRDQSPMAGDQHVTFINQHGVGEAELAYRPDDLLDLTLRMRPRVTRIGFERTCRPVHDSQLTKRRLSPPGTLVHASEHSLNKEERQANKFFSGDQLSDQTCGFAANGLFKEASGLLKAKNAPDLAD